MKLFDKLESEFGEKVLIKGKDDLEKYSKDETPGEISCIPDAALRVESIDEITDLIEMANADKFPVIPRGGGTSRTGGPLAVNGGVVLSLEKMQNIIDIDEKNMIVELEPGVITEDINEELEKYGLFYPPDPASVDSCSIGGNVSTNAGGARCLKYGLTRDYVRGIEVVMPDGSVEFLGGKLKKNATGYSLLNLIIGSEGTLGVISRIYLNIIKMPEFISTLLVPFKKLEKAALAAFELLSSGLIPSALEFMDEDSVKTTMENTGNEIPVQPEGSFLIVEIDGFKKENVEEKFEKIGKIFLEHGAEDVFVAEQKFQREKIWEFRRSISEGLDEYGTVIPEDISIPRSKIPEFVSRVKDMEKEFNTKIFTFGHIGDGNLHIDIIKKDEWKENGEKIVFDLLKTATDFGGKISGEHGIGMTKKKYLHFSRTEKEIDCMRGIKRQIDPENLMNPGKIFEMD